MTEYIFLTCQHDRISTALSRLPTSDDITVTIQKLQPTEDRAGYTLPTKGELRNAYLEDPLCSKLIKYFDDQEKKELPQERKDIVFEGGIL